MTPRRGRTLPCTPDARSAGSGETGVPGTPARTLTRRTLGLAGALVLDHLVGEPSPHPVRGIGALLRHGRNRALEAGVAPGGAPDAAGAEAPPGATSGPTAGPRGQRQAGSSPPTRATSFLAGAATLAVAGGGVALAARWVQGRVAAAPRGPAAAAEAALLKPALALDALLEAGREVEEALAAGNLEEARRLLGWHLVSRDTRTLTPGQVASGAIESLAENLVDSVVAPAAAYLVAGLPGAWAYRVVNTADAMFGYRTPELEWFGKAPARLDDALNFLPARWTGAALLAAGRGVGGLVPEALGALAREAGKAAGPNAGWPMAAAALALDVVLEKPGVYRLHPGGRTPDHRDLRRARALVVRGGLLSLGTLTAALAGGSALSRVVSRRRP
jgi:adenosylcobinamide-phosphate synthase